MSWCKRGCHQIYYDLHNPPTWHTNYRENLDSVCEIRDVYSHRFSFKIRGIETQKVYTSFGSQNEIIPYVQLASSYVSYSSPLGHFPLPFITQIRRLLHGYRFEYISIQTTIFISRMSFITTKPCG